MTPEEMNIPAKDLAGHKPKHPHDFRDSLHWRIFRIMSEFVEGFQFLADYQKTVTFFGSARFKEDNPHYQEAVDLAKRLTQEGFTIITGGGPGIMEGGNRGAAEVDLDKSVGVNIELEDEQRKNPFVHKGMGFHYFFTRKVMLSYAARAYVFFPGGYGTLDEFFEMVTLIQTKKIAPIPVILIGKDFWEPLTEWFKESLLKDHQTIDAEDLGLYTLVSTIEEAHKLIKDAPPRKELFENHEL